MVQIQKQGQKVIVNINEKKPTKRRKRTKKGDLKKGGANSFSNPYPFVPPIVITPFGEVHKPFQPNPIMRDPILDNVKSGGDVFKTPSKPSEIFEKDGDFSNVNPLLRDYRIKRFSNEPDNESVNSDMSQSSFKSSYQPSFGLTEAFPLTETGRSELLYETASSGNSLLMPESINSSFGRNVDVSRGGGGYTPDPEIHELYESISTAPVVDKEKKKRRERENQKAREIYARQKEERQNMNLEDNPKYRKNIKKP